MARSFKRTPVFGITTAGSEKYSKRLWNRVFRKTCKKLMRNEKELPVKLSALTDVWAGAKDGKRYRRDAVKKDMRK